VVQRGQRGGLSALETTAVPTVVAAAPMVAAIDGAVAGVRRGTGEQLGLARAQCEEGDGRGASEEVGEVTGVEFGGGSVGFYRGEARPRRSGQVDGGVAVPGR
jgi:hypothetical protein